MHCVLQKAESDWLIYNHLLYYIELILNGDTVIDLKSVSYMGDEVKYINNKNLMIPYSLLFSIYHILL
ncbi:MAG: DUF6061 family protein [Lachnospiraceae bacterium]